MELDASLGELKFAIEQRLGILREQQRLLILGAALLLSVQLLWHALIVMLARALQSGQARAG